jgi:hypothetical protein
MIPCSLHIMQVQKHAKVSKQKLERCYQSKQDACVSPDAEDEANLHV